MGNDTLHEMIEKAPGCLGDRMRFESLLWDFFPYDKRTIHILMCLYDAGFIEELLAKPSADTGLLKKIEEQMREEYGIDGQILLKLMKDLALFPEQEADGAAGFQSEPENRVIQNSKNRRIPNTQRENADRQGGGIQGGCKNENAKDAVRGSFGAGSAIEEADRVEGDPFFYSCEENGDSTVRISRYYGEKKAKIVVPNYIGGKRVTGIEGGAFLGHPVLERLTISKGIVFIGRDAFKGCKRLREASFPQTLQTVGEGAFRDCQNLYGIRIASYGGLSVGKGAFRDCKFVGDISLFCGGGKLAVEEDAFFGDSYNTVSLKAPRLSVGDRAFAVNGYAKRICMDGVVEKVGADAFTGGKYYFSDFPVEEIGENAFGRGSFYCYPNPMLQDYAWKHRIRLYKRLREGAFEYAQAAGGTISVERPLKREISEMKIPGTVSAGQVEKIAPYAFENCGKLKKVLFPSGITEIGECVFWSCNGLEEVRLPKGLAKIGRNAFWSCTSLRQIELPDTVTSIEYGTFSSCYRLAKVKLPSRLEYIKEEAFGCCFSLKEIVIPDSVRKIGKGAFDRCENLKDIYLPRNVTLSPDSLPTGQFGEKEGITVHCYPNTQAYSAAREGGYQVKGRALLW